MIDLLEVVLPPIISAAAIGLVGAVGLKYMATMTKQELERHIAEDKDTHEKLNEKVQSLCVDVAGRLASIETVLRERLPERKAE